MRANFFFLVFSISFVVFNLNFTSMGVTDTIPASLLPFNLFTGHGIYFDHYYPLVKQYFDLIIFFETSHGHVVSSFPLISGILSIPIYFPFYLSMLSQGKTTPYDFFMIANLLEKLSASLIASTSVGCFFFLMCRLTSKRTVSIAFSLIFAFATQTFSISSQALWQHGSANLFLILSQLFFLKSLNSSHTAVKETFLSMLFAFLSFASRAMFFLYFLTVSILLTKRAHAHRYIVIGVLFAGTLSIVCYNLYFYNSPFSDYISHANAFALGNVKQAFLGLLFSPGRGILFYSPFYFFAVFSVLFWRKIRQNDDVRNAFYCLNLIYFFLGILVNSFWGFWWGGESWGNRFFTDIAVPAVLLSYFFYEHAKSRIARTFFVVLICYSIFTQCIGTFNYPSSYWDIYPAQIDFSPKRLWDFKDSPILRSIAVGTDFQAFGRFIATSITDQRSQIYTADAMQCSLRLLSISHFVTYRIAHIAFTNDSTTDWITSSSHPPYRLTLKQIYYKKNHETLSSPITPVNIPQVIKAHETIVLTALLIAPGKGYTHLVITPFQDEQPWLGSCRLVLTEE